MVLFLVQFLRPKNQKCRCVKFLSEAGEDVTARQSEFSFPPPFCSIQNYNGLDDAHPHWEGQSTGSNANLIWKHPDTPAIMFRQISWYPHDSVKLIQKLTIIIILSGCIENKLQEAVCKQEDYGYYIIQQREDGSLDQYLGSGGGKSEWILNLL